MIDVIALTETPDHADAELVFLAMHPAILEQLAAFEASEDDGRRDN